METIFNCSECGAELSENECYCHACGMKAVRKEPDLAVCRECGAALGLNAQFCSTCGAKVFDAGFVSEKKTEDALRTKMGRGKYVKAIVKKSTVMLVAILTLIFAFLPVASLKADTESPDGDKIKLSVNLSTVDVCILFFDSLKSLDEEEIADTALYEKIEDIVSDLTDDPDDAELNSKMAYCLLRLGLQSEYSPSRAVYLIAALLCAIYVLLALSLFGFSLADLLLFIFNKESLGIWKTAVYILAVIPFYAVVLYAAVKFSYFDAFAGLNMQSSFSPAGALVTAVVFCLLALAYIAVDRIFLSGKITVRVGEIIKRSLSFFAATVLLFSVFLPVASFNAKGHFNISEKRQSVTVGVDISYFGVMDLTDDMRDVYEEIHVNDAYRQVIAYVQNLSRYSKKDVEKGKAESVVSSIMSSSFLGFGGVEYSSLFALVPLIGILAALLAALVLWQNAIAVALGRSPIGGIVIPSRITVCLLAVLTLVMIIIFMTVCNYNLAEIDESVSIKCSLTIAPGAIVGIIFAVATLCIPMKKKKINNIIDK